MGFFTPFSISNADYKFLVDKCLYINYKKIEILFINFMISINNKSVYL
jgi:hypothetical protein